MNEQEFAELSAAAALNALSPDDERRYRAALAVHPEWRRIARADADTAAALAASVEPAPPPEGMRAALLAAISDVPQTDAERPSASSPAAPPSPRADEGVRREGTGRLDPREATASSAPPDDHAAEPRPQRPRRLRVLFALAACLVLLVGVGTGVVALSSALNRPAAVVALEQIEAAEDAQQAAVAVADGGSATAHWSASLGRAVLVTQGIATPGDGQTYELWFVRGDTAVSAGTFSVHEGDATAELQGRMQAGDAIAVTVEDSGGSATGAPTSDPVIVIPTA